MPPFSPSRRTSRAIYPQAFGLGGFFLTESGDESHRR